MNGLSDNFNEGGVLGIRSVDFSRRNNRYTDTLKGSSHGRYQSSYNSQGQNFLKKQDQSIQHKRPEQLYTKKPIDPMEQEVLGLDDIDIDDVCENDIGNENQLGQYNSKTSLMNYKFMIIMTANRTDCGKRAR